jgi:O-antigen ligase
MGLLKILFIILVLIFPLAEVSRFQFSNGIAISLNDIILSLTVAVWLIYRLINRKKKTKPGFLKKPILVFTAIAAISLLVNVFNLNPISASISAMYLVRWLLYAFIYFIVLDFDRAFKKIAANALLVSGSLVVFAGYIQFFFFPSLRNLFYLGWDDHLYRMFSTFLDPNFAGAFFVMFFLLTLSILINNLKKITNIKTIVLIILCLSSLGAVYLTYSRSAFLMLVVGLLSFLWLKGKRKALIAVFFVLVMLIFISPKAFKLEGTNFLRIVSTQERIVSLEQGLGVFLKSPVLGVGFNSFRYALNRDFGMNNSNWQTSHAGAGTDNSFLFVLATTGVIGFSIFIYLILKMLLLARRYLKNEYAILFCGIILGLIADSVFINSFFYVLILEWVWILAAFTESNVATESS